jgi:hypothetical protein
VLMITVNVGGINLRKTVFSKGKRNRSALRCRPLHPSRPRGPSAKFCSGETAITPVPPLETVEFLRGERKNVMWQLAV